MVTRHHCSSSRHRVRPRSLRACMGSTRFPKGPFSRWRPAPLPFPTMEVLYCAPYLPCPESCVASFPAPDPLHVACTTTVRVCSHSRSSEQARCECLDQAGTEWWPNCRSKEAFWVQIPVASCLLFGLAFVAGLLLVTAVRCRMLVFPAAC